jgi:hypothetical protein
MEITKETSRSGDLRYGHVAVGTATVRLCNSFTTLRGVLIKCDRANSASIYIGGSQVQANNGPIGGMPLTPGMSLVIPIDDPGTLYAISTDVDQDLAWMAV